MCVRVRARARERVCGLTSPMSVISLLRVRSASGSLAARCALLVATNYSDFFSADPMLLSPNPGGVDELRSPVRVWRPHGRFFAFRAFTPDPGPAVGVAGTDMDVGYMLGAPPKSVKDAIDSILVSWKCVEDERADWALEKARLEAEVKRLRSSVAMHEKVQKTLVQRVKMLEFSLKKAAGARNTGRLSKAAGRGPSARVLRARNRCKTLPAYLQKGKVDPERIRLIVKDLIAYRQSAIKKEADESNVSFGGDSIRGEEFGEEGLLLGQGEGDDSVLQADEDAGVGVNDENIHDNSADVKRSDDDGGDTATAKPAQSQQPAETVLVEGPATEATVEPPTDSSSEYKQLQSLGAREPVVAPKGWSVTCALRSHLDGVRSVSFHPTRPLVLSGSEDGAVKLWSVDYLMRRKKPRHKEEPVFTYRGHAGFVTATLVDAKRCYSAGTDGAVNIWALPTEDQNQYTEFGECSPLLMRSYRDRDAVWGLCSIRDSLLFSACSDGCVSVWNLDKEAASNGESKDASPAGPSQRLGRSGAQAITRGVVGVSAAPSKDQVYAAYTDGSVAVFDAETGRETMALQPSAESRGVCLASHPFLNLGFVGYADGSYSVFDPKAGQFVYRKAKAHRDVTTSLSVAHNGIMMATASHDMSIRIWDLRRNAIAVDMDPNQHRQKFDEAIHSVAYHNESSTLASGGADSIVKIYIA